MNKCWCKFLGQMIIIIIILFIIDASCLLFEASSKTFWVGGIQFQKNWYWKYSTWKIPISSNRWFMSYEENEKVVAHTDHLDSNVPNAKVQFICERNYFSRNDIFTKLTLHKNANQLLSKEDGGEIECASRCLLTYDCQLILLQSDGTCRLYSVGSPNIKIDCTSTGSQCFYRNKPKY